MTDEPRQDEPEPTTTEAATGVVEAKPPGDQPAGDEPKAPPKLQQTVDIVDAGPCKKHIKVTLDRGSIDKRLNEKFSELVNDSNVSGFRPGKAPRRIIERRFQKEVTDQVKAELLLQSLEQLAEDHDIAPLSAPNIDPFKIDLPKEGPLVYEFDVEVRPDFDLPNYKGLRLRRPVREFTDDDVAQEERRLLAPHGQLVPKTEGGAEIGDIVISDVITREGDRVLSELKEFAVRVEKRLAFKDGVARNFYEQIKGAKAGDTRKVDITLSRRSADQALQGKTVEATFEVKDVKMLRLPELTHEFLHTFGVHSEDQLRELLRAHLQRRLEYEQRMLARQQVLEQIAGAGQWQLPEDLLIRQARKALGRRVMEMQAQGMAEDEIRGRIRVLEQDVLRNTALALKEHFVLQKIAETEKIDVDDDDLAEEIDRIADQNNESPRRLRARIERDDLMDALAAELIERRALDLILDSAEYEDVPVDKDDASAVSTVEEQAVKGEMHELSPPAEETAAEQPKSE